MDCEHNTKAIKKFGVKLEKKIKPMQKKIGGKCNHLHGPSKLDCKDKEK